MRYFVTKNPSNITYSIFDINQHIEINYIFTNIKTEHVDFIVFKNHDFLAGNLFFRPQICFYMEYDPYKSKRLTSAELYGYDLTNHKELIDNAMPYINDKCGEQHIKQPEKQLVDDFYAIDFDKYIFLIRGI